MMGEKARIPLGAARELADELLRCLGPVCERLDVAGSIRRQKADVGDVELVAVPKTDHEFDLFGLVVGEHDRLHQLCLQLLEQGVFGLRLDKNERRAFGERFKRLLYYHSGRTVPSPFPLDLFVVTPPAQWGVVMAIRTGCAEFSHRLVTPTWQGGWLPPGFRIRDGALWECEQLVPTPTEAALFGAIGLELPPPAVRTETYVPRKISGAVVSEAQRPPSPEIAP